MGESLPVSICVPGFQVGVANMKWEGPLDGVQIPVTNESPRDCVDVEEEGAGAWAQRHFHFQGTSWRGGGSKE